MAPFDLRLMSYYRLWAPEVRPVETDVHQLDARSITVETLDDLHLALRSKPQVQGSEHLVLISAVQGLTRIYSDHLLKLVEETRVSRFILSSVSANDH